jgi:glycosyltransferase involved in cell wall biosynthesis
MRVLINAAGANMGGAVTYLTNLLPQLADLRREQGRDDHYIVVAPTETLDKLSATLSQDCFSQVAYRLPPAQNLARIKFDQLEVRHLLRKEGADLLFSSNGFGTFVSPCPELLLVRNPIYFCQLYEERFRQLGRSLRDIKLRRYWSLASIRMADRVLYPTEAMADLVAPFMRVPASKARAIHYGFNRETFFAEGAEPPEIALRMNEWRQSGEKVLLAVSAFAVHKNFETLVEALPAIRDAGHRVRLVMTLSREKTGDKVEFDAMMRRIDELGLADVVQLAGHVAYQQLQHLYQAADLFVFPSFAESFGHSMVEAMSCGLPSVAADIPVNAEVLGDAAEYFDVFDPADCGRVIAKILSDGDEYEALCERARARAWEFSWRKYAEALLGEFDALAGR